MAFEVHLRWRCRRRCLITKPWDHQHRNRNEKLDRVVPVLSKKHAGSLAGTIANRDWKFTCLLEQLPFFSGGRWVALAGFWLQNPRRLGRNVGITVDSRFMIDKVGNLLGTICPMQGRTKLTWEFASWRCFPSADIHWHYSQTPERRRHWDSAAGWGCPQA